MTCWAPVHFTSAQVKFANQYCWIKNTYYQPWNSELQHASKIEKQQMVSYYQWIPFVLLTQVSAYVHYVSGFLITNSYFVDTDLLNFFCRNFKRLKTY